MALPAQWEAARSRRKLDCLQNWRIQVAQGPFLVIFRGIVAGCKCTALFMNSMSFVRFKGRLSEMRYHLNLRLPLLVIGFVLLAGSALAQSPADAVNPLVGTAAEGQTFPGVGVPFGMTQWTPATQDSERKAVVPYFYTDHDFRGIRGSHFLSGSATQEYGSFQLLAGDGSFP